MVTLKIRTIPPNPRTVTLGHFHSETRSGVEVRGWVTAGAPGTWLTPGVSLQCAMHRGARWQVGCTVRRGQARSFRGQDSAAAVGTLLGALLWPQILCARSHSIVAAI